MTALRWGKALGLMSAIQCKGWGIELKSHLWKAIGEIVDESCRLFKKSSYFAQPFIQNPIKKCNF